MTNLSSLPAPQPEDWSLDGRATLINRDLSLLEFQRRVLDEGRDERNPLLERVKFLSIVCSNLYEFMMTRAGELTRAGEEAVLSLDAGRVHPLQHLETIETEIKALLLEAREHLERHIVPALADEGIHLLEYEDLQAAEREEVATYFQEAILPLLMPLAFDETRPFPLVHSRDLTLAVLVRDRERAERFVCIQIPPTVPMFVPLRHRIARGQGSSHHVALEHGFVWVDQVITANLETLLPGMTIAEVHPFRLIRDAELQAESMDAEGLVNAIEHAVRRRQFGEVVSLVVQESMPASMVEVLARRLGLQPEEVHTSKSLRELRRLAELARVERADLRDPRLVPRTPAAFDRPQARDVFACIQEQDILLHHPFESFEPVVDFVEQAARDPDVVAISSTLYRVGTNAPVVHALLEAARSGKQVRAVVELRARFDEEYNIAWARALADAGAHVSYGMPGLKVHAKVTLVVRREGQKLRRYVHVGTGNYNTATATVYTDLGLMTCDPEICGDATDLFNFLSGFTAPADFRRILVAPRTMRARFNELVEDEISCQRRGGAGRIILKMNALTDRDAIQLLYRASQAGVDIDLIVRGMCCLRPGVPGLSETIRVRSIVGRFLEHGRIWYFGNAGGHERIYIGSADLMPRNLDRRVEVMVPVEDGRLKRRVRDTILAAYLADNVKARVLEADGSYTRPTPADGEPPVSSQDRLLQEP